MRILGIETSCDETALALLDCSGNLTAPKFKVLGESLISQIDLHKQYGGVFPMMAKREHAKNLIPLFKQLLEKSGDITMEKLPLTPEAEEELSKILERESGLLTAFKEFIPSIKKPNIDAIAVTEGPGLEPALWVGINFAKALSLVWNIPLIPINHMEGHIFSVLIRKDLDVSNIKFPALALLISGGHTELVLVESWLTYKLIGQTRDDAVGEAFDKVARILALPYPGGPEISKLAAQARTAGQTFREKLPRPMIHSADSDFSFSGIKTAVLYSTRKNPVSDAEKPALAREFEDAVTEVLWKKTSAAIEEFNIQTVIIAGGVSANKHIREIFEKETAERGIALLIPDLALSTDNAVMIAAAAYMRISAGHGKRHLDLRAKGTLKLST